MKLTKQAIGSLGKKQGGIDGLARDYKIIHFKSIS